jgi:hypothetical protein
VLEVRGLTNDEKRKNWVVT